MRMGWVYYILVLAMDWYDQLKWMMGNEGNGFGWVLDCPNGSTKLC